MYTHEQTVEIMQDIYEETDLAVSLKKQEENE